MAAPFFPPSVATVFLDLYGVLADSHVMEVAYNERMAAILRRRFGGPPLATWRRVQQESYDRYQAQGAELDRRPDPLREGDAWVDAVWAMNVEQLRFIFDHIGLPPPPDLAALYEAVEAETVSGVDALFPDARPALRALRDAGHRLFLSTNANRSNGESALVGGGVRDLFDGLLVLETARAKKDTTHYWQNAFRVAGTAPPDAVCADDVARYLAPAAALGARCVQVLRPGLRRERGAYPVIESLAALPALL